jgi:hypothetical protein
LGAIKQQQWNGSTMKTKHNNSKRALLTFAREAEPLLDRWGHKFVTTYGREPSNREVDKAVRAIINALVTSG